MSRNGRLEHILTLASSHRGAIDLFVGFELVLINLLSHGAEVEVVWLSEFVIEASLEAGIPLTIQRIHLPVLALVDLGHRLVQEVLGPEIILTPGRSLQHGSSGADTEPLRVRPLGAAVV